MKTITYSKETRELLDHIKAHTPDRVLCEIQYTLTFDYGKYHINILPESLDAATQNEYDEAIVARVERLDSTFRRGEHDELLFEKSAVDRIWILRTILYFTDEVVYTDVEREIKTAELTPPDAPPGVADVFSKIVSGHEEKILHPKSELVQGLNEEFSKVLEAGFVFELDSNFLVCCPVNNSFTVYGQVMTQNQLLEEIAPFYELILV